MKSFALFLVLAHLFGCATTVPVKPADTMPPYPPGWRAPLTDLDVPTGQMIPR